MYPKLTNLIYHIFGVSQLVALLLNACILTISCILVYLNSKIILKNDKYSFIATLMYIFWPANILYTLIYTQEHLCTLLLLLSTYILLKNIDKKLDIYTILKYILIGLILAVSTFLKNFASVLLLSIFIYFILNIFIVENKKKYAINKGIICTLILITYICLRSIIFIYMDSVVQEKVMRSIAPCYINVGAKGNGTYNDVAYSEYFDELKKQNYDNKKTNKIIMHKLIKNINIKQYIKLLYNKAQIILGDDRDKTYWIFSTINSDGKYTKYMSKFAKINNIYYGILVILMATGLIKMVKEKNLKIFLMYLIFFGGMLLLILVEAQNRYMYALQYIICILASYGILTIDKLIDSKINKSNE